METLELSRNVDDSVEIISHKPYSAHPDDSHLSVVLAKWINYYNKIEYITWMHNSTDKGLHGGNYFPDLESALKDYDKRGK